MLQLGPSKWNLQSILTLQSSTFDITKMGLMACSFFHVLQWSMVGGGMMGIDMKVLLWWVVILKQQVTKIPQMIKAGKLHVKLYCKKIWREPSVLNLWQPGCGGMVSMKKTKGAFHSTKILVWNFGNFTCPIKQYIPVAQTWPKPSRIWSLYL